MVYSCGSFVTAYPTEYLLYLEWDKLKNREMFLALPPVKLHHPSESFDSGVSFSPVHEYTRIKTALETLAIRNPDLPNEMPLFRCFGENIRQLYADYFLRKQFRIRPEIEASIEQYYKVYFSRNNEKVCKVKRQGKSRAKVERRLLDRD